MVEKMQCPVCTLFLHAGMDLSDHLETHPKEQVIRALVELTLPRAETKEPAGHEDPDTKMEENKVDVEPIIPKIASKLEKDLELCINSSNDSISSTSFASSSFPRTLNLSSGGQQQQPPPPPPQKSAAPPLTSSGFTNASLAGKHAAFNSQNITFSPSYQRNIGPVDLVDNGGGGNATDIKSTAAAVNELPQISTDFSNFSNRYQQHHQHQQPVAQPANQQQQKLEGHTKLQPSSLAPSELAGHLVGQFSSAAPPNAFHSKQQRQQLQFPPPLHVHQHQHQSQHRLPPHPLSLPQQQNLKVIYSPALPPPAIPPASQIQVQLFNYQVPPQPPHQKPPPAYGTAISQIRSQHNQGKKGSQQQQLQPHTQRNAVASTSKQLHAKKNATSHGNGVFPVKVSQKKQHLHHPQQQSETAPLHQQQFAKNVLSNSAAASSLRKPGTYQQCGDDATAPPTTPASSSAPEMPTSSTAVVPQPPLPAQPSSLHTRPAAHSPYPAILNVSSSSCSSVLRYAESPVTAHYLERDNGDFIVQETPKRIVECVEKDNGEFSVIERIYQSPPSVLRIHDDDDDDDDEDDERNEELEVGGGGGGDVTGKETAAKTEKNKQLEANKKNGNDKLTHETEEDFMSVDGDSEMDESTCEKPISAEGKERTTNSSHAVGCVEKPTTSAAAAAAAATAAANENTGTNAWRKSSKNTITVLSDVQLNLNEYLDLVGNIIASSKIPKSQTFGAAAPMPLVKVEKVEPIDEYEEVVDQCQQDTQLDEKLIVKNTAQNVDDRKTATAAAATTCLREPPNLTTFKNKENTSETDELVASNFSDKAREEEESIDDEKLGKQNAANASFSSHATTSVIRMATTTTSQQNLPEAMEQEHQHHQAAEDTSMKNRQAENVDIMKASDRLRQVSLNNNPNAAAEDLSPYAQIKCEVLSSTEAARVPSLPAPSRKGPKKLVIKPKSGSAAEAKTSSKISCDPLCAEQPTTLAKAKKLECERDQQLVKHSSAPKNVVVIKSEPNTCNEGPAASTQESHSKISCALHAFELKQEKSSSREEAGHANDFKQDDALHLDIKNEREELNNHSNNNNNNNNVSKLSLECGEDQLARSAPLRAFDENARVLLDFPSSSRSEMVGAATSNAHTFPSANSIFGVASSSAEKSILSHNSTSNSKLSPSPSLITATSAASGNALATLRCEDEFIVPDATDAVQEIVISSCYSSQSASDVALHNFGDTHNHHHQQPHQQQHNFSDYPFSFLYGGGGGGSLATEIVAKSSFAQIYQQQPHDATTAATLASGSNSTIEEYTSDPGQGEHTLGAPYNHPNDAPPAPRPWYQSVSTSNADYEAALAVDCGVLEGGDADDAGSYLDLDSYKRVNMTGGRGAQTIVAAPSSSLSSFTAATESSLAGCTTDALNIRTDEKMPAKGEISEQESNCDIENSWSQSIYGDIPVRFFKSSFPGLLPPENCWNHEEYFTVQDLSASAGTTNISNRATKSFDFRLPLQDVAATTSSSSAVAPATASTAGCSSSQQHADNLPSTSSKKKRKRESNAPKNAPGAGTAAAAAAAASTSTSTGRTIAATVTSQDLLLQQEQLHQVYQEVPTTSAAIQASLTTAAAAASSSGAASALDTATAAQSRSGKVFSCVHCFAKFSRLRDRNLHMIAQHNYVLRNYRLVPVQKVVAVPATAMAMAKSTFAPATIADVEVVSRGAPRGQQLSEELEEDSKRDISYDIVKLEVEPTEQSAVSRLASTEVDTVGEMLTKSELDDKDALSALATEGVATGGENSTDPVFLPSLTRLYNLYHMLISFNIAALKQNQTLSEEDEKLMLSSIFFCFICRQKFGTVKLYDAHMTEHPAECYTCGKKFQRWQNLSLHLKRHLGWKEFGCNICEKKFVVRSALVEHMRMHTGQKPLKCNICDKHFKRFSNLAQHRKRHGKQIIRKKEFVCHCGEVLPSKARFLWHKETHDAKPKCCQYCCDRFVHANSLRRHIRLAHSDKFDYTEPMECPMCKQVFAKSSIRAHMATHSMDMQHVCSICSKSFSTKWNLKIHSWVHANRTAKPFKCEHCPKAFVREVDFKNHINAHKQIKPYTCEYCGCKFIRKYNYLRHRREHHGNKKFTCDLCKKSFHRHYYLIEHRRIHTGERPFQCTICGKSSTTKTNHNKHLKIHHSRDPFTVEA